MIEGKRILAIVPARGGSKGLPGKNIRNLAGKPLISWSIEQALRVNGIDRVVVSTDDADIARIAKHAGASIPFMRPANLASDTATTQDVLIHCVKSLDENFDVIVLLQPTSPLRADETLTACMHTCIEKGKVTISVSASSKPVEWMFYRENEQLLPILPLENTPGRRQDCKTPYYIDGSVYCFPVDTLMTNEKLVDESAQSVISSANESVDIDTLEDFYYCEYLMTRK